MICIKYTINGPNDPSSGEYVKNKNTNIFQKKTNFEAKTGVLKSYF